MDNSYNFSFNRISDIKTKVIDGSIKNFKELSFLVYGLGITGKSVINFFERNNIKNYQVWDDNKSYKKKTLNLEKTLNDVNYIVLSPGVSLKISKNKKNY